MRNLFLYEKTFIEKSLLPKITGVYDFEACPLVGIDSDIISRTDRIKIVQSARLRELFILQEWLLSFIRFASELDITIMSLDLNIPVDEEVKDSISKGIKSYDYKKLSAFLVRIMEFHECDIKSITFNYKSQMLSILTDGVLSIYDDGITDDIKRSNILCIISGHHQNNFDYEDKPLWD